RQRRLARVEVERGAVVEATDLAVLQFAVAQRVALVGAAIRQGEQLATLPDDHDLDVPDDPRRYGAFGELLGGPDVEGLRGHAHSFSFTPGTPSLAWTTRSTYSATLG